MAAGFGPPAGGDAAKLLVAGAGQLRPAGRRTLRRVALAGGAAAGAPGARIHRPGQGRTRGSGRGGRQRRIGPPGRLFQPDGRLPDPLPGRNGPGTAKTPCYHGYSGRLSFRGGPPRPPDVCQPPFYRASRHERKGHDRTQLLGNTTIGHVQPGMPPFRARPYPRG